MVTVADMNISMEVVQALDVLCSQPWATDSGQASERSRGGVGGGGGGGGGGVTPWHSSPRAAVHVTLTRPQ